MELTNMHLELASDERSYALVDFLVKYFYADETITKSLGIEFDATMKKILLQRYSQNLSLLLVCDVTDEIIGCRTIILKRQTSALDPVRNSSTVDVDEKIKIAVRFLSHKDTDMDVCRYFNVNEYVQFINLCVRNDYRRQGLATKLMESALQFLKQIGPGALCIKGEATSNHSQRIYEKFGFICLHVMNYEDYTENGKVVLMNTGENKSCRIYVKQLK